LFPSAGVSQVSSLNQMELIIDVNTLFGKKSFHLSPSALTVVFKKKKQKPF